MSTSQRHTRISHIGAACAVVCLLFVLLPGCVQVTPTLEPVTISFTYGSADDAYYQALVKKFNQTHPHITVELHPQSASGLWIAQGIRTSEGKDSFVSSHWVLSWLRENESILNLTSFIEQDGSLDVSDFYPNTIDALRADGSTWAIPAGVNTLVMFYNQDLFDRYNVPYPEVGWTWDDFLQTALATRDPEANVFGFAVKYATDNFWAFPYATFDALAFIYQHGGQVFDDLQDPTRATFDAPLNVEALEWYISLMQDHDVAPSPEQARQVLVDYPDISSGVYGDKFSMWTGWLTERGGRGSWLAEWDMRWGMVPLPRDRQAATLGNVEGYFISAEASHPEACWQWISFLSQQVPSRLAPARRSLAESAAYERQVGSNVAEVARASVDSAFQLPVLTFEGQRAFFQTFGREVKKVIRGLATPQEAMSQAQQESEKIFR